jgi:hypothetical protein
MTNEEVHIPDAVLRALWETAEAAGERRLTEVMAAAAWAFSLQSESFRDQVVLEYCLRGQAEAGTRARKTIKEQIHEVLYGLCAPFRRRAAR